jgi:hypothetical protein
MKGGMSRTSFDQVLVSYMTGWEEHNPDEEKHLKMKCLQNVFVGKKFANELHPTFKRAKQVMSPRASETL